jgi:hypothetical protein
MNPLRKTLVGVAILGSTLGGAAIGIASTGSANAATSGTAPTTAAASTAATDSSAATPAADSTTQQAPPDGQGGPHGQPGDPSKGGHVANGITETVLTGDDATKATAAAEAAVSGGTVVRAETDAEGASFEVHMTKADGSSVTVKLNADFSVASILDGFA